MEKIKFRYRIQDKAGKVITQIYTLEEIEMGLLSKCYSLDYKILSRDQSTNLGDKNGKEIYGGDIVKNQYGAVGEYVWSESRSGWDIQFRKFPGFETMNEWEIIGNIHENPELLT